MKTADNNEILLQSMALSDAEQTPPPLNLAALREKAAARRTRRTLAIVSLGSALSGIAVLFGLFLLLRASLILEYRWLLLPVAVGGAAFLSAGLIAVTLFLYKTRGGKKGGLSL